MARPITAATPTSESAMMHTTAHVEAVVTEKDWTEEVARALAGAGLPCRVHAAWIDHGGEMCHAEVTDTRSGKERTIRLSRLEFASVAARRAEITRQLQGGRDPLAPNKPL
jgi:hypothetical protein